MCRKILIPAAALTALGVGLLAGCWIRSCVWQTLAGAAAIGAGVWLMKCR